MNQIKTKTIFPLFIYWNVKVELQFSGKNKMHPQEVIPHNLRKVSIKDHFLFSTASANGAFAEKVLFSCKTLFGCFPCWRAYS